MTLIASYITQFGIIQASDSNLTSDIGNTGYGQKIFPIPHLNASMAYSGVYSINGTALDIWINDFIAGSYYSANTIEEFTKQLSKRLNSEIREYEVSEVSIMHIAGFQKQDYISFVEHWHISNSNLLDNGMYDDPEDSFHYSNDFNSFKNEDDRALLRKFDTNSLVHKYYINGFPPGRISSVVIKQKLDQSLNIIWSNPDWKFKKPENIFEFSNLVKLYFDFVIRLFPMSNYNAMYIGGDIQTHLIPAPQNLLKE